MDKDTRITGIAWRYDGYPSIAEYKAFFDRPDAVLKIWRVGGQMQASIPLEVIPSSPIYDDHTYVFPIALLAGEIERWEVPKEVAILRLTLGDGSYYALDMKWLARARNGSKMTFRTAGIKLPSEEQQKALARVCSAADRPCEHPEQAKGNDPFCGKCLSCRAGMLLLQMSRITKEQAKVTKPVVMVKCPGSCGQMIRAD